MGDGRTAAPQSQPRLVDHFPDELESPVSLTVYVELEDTAVPLGERLAAAGLVSKEDVARALQQQREAGGVLGDNLVRLGVIGRNKLEEFLEQGPPKLSGAADTGLEPNFLRGLTLKVMYSYSVKTAKDIAEVLKLPVPLMRELLEGMRVRGLLESLGVQGTGRQLELRYDLSPVGKESAQKALEQSLYSGPAPVPLKQWQTQVDRQRITNDRVDREALARSLAGLVIPPEMIARFGPAVNAGRGMLLYGAPGDGKTSVARAIALSFKQSIWVPYAIEVDHEIIKIFDPALHRPSGDSERPEEYSSALMRTQVSGQDRRWVRCARPVAVIGGELTMDMLDLKFDTLGLYSEAPLHTKATGGVLVVDDFGRQVARPEQVLNRWVLPLESQIDFLTLHTGRKFPVTFDGLVIFSTNLTPSTIMDAAMMRRIPYNFHIAPPTQGEYLQIFRRVCAEEGLPFDVSAVREAMSMLYEDADMAMARFHPRFIVEHLVAQCNYEGREPTLDPQLMFDAAQHLYTKQ